MTLVMNRFFLLLLTAVIFCSCDSNEDDSIRFSTDGFDFVVSTNQNVSIDEKLTLRIDSSEEMSNVLISLDNFQSNIGNSSYGPGYGKLYRFFLNFQQSGLQTVFIKGRNFEDEEIIKTVNIEVTKKDVAKIVGLEVVTFHRIDQTWDPEFSIDDPNRLADVGFEMYKPKISISDGDSFPAFWHNSIVKENQEDLKWDFSNNDLYIGSNVEFQFHLLDSDPRTGSAQVLAPESVNFETYSFSQFSRSKPESIIYKNPSSQLELIFYLEWE